MNRHSDHRFIEAFRRGDSSILESLYQSYGPQVLTWIKNNSGNHEDARDIFQEAILAVHTKACDPSFHLTYPIGALIMQICKNKWIDELRKRKKEHEVRAAEKQRYIDIDVEPLAEDIIEEEQKQKKLRSAYSHLSELCQSLLRLVSKGIKANEIANQLKMNDANTVYRRKNACISRWKDLYNKTKP